MLPTLLWPGVVILTLALIQSRRYQSKLLMELEQSRTDLMTAAINSQDCAVKLVDGEEMVKKKDEIIMKQHIAIIDYKKKEKASNELKIKLEKEITDLKTVNNHVNITSGVQNVTAGIDMKTNNTVKTKLEKEIIYVKTVDKPSNITSDVSNVTTGIGNKTIVTDN